MGGSLFATLIQNAGLLLVLVVVLDLLTFQRTYHNRIAVLVGIGTLLGVIGSVTMLNAWEFAPGIVFDTRSVVLAITGLFFGWIPTLVAVTLTTGTRLYLGGGAALTGILVIVASAAIGLAWRYHRRHRIADLTLGEFYIFGVVVHGVMLGLMFTLPLTVAVAVLDNITFPILLVYPVVTALVAALLRNRLRGERDRRALSENEERLRLATDAAGQGLYDLDVRSGQINVNDEYARLTGERPEGFRETLDKWTERLHEQDRERVITTLNDYLSGTIEDYQVEFRQRRADGGWSWVLSVGRIVARDAQGNPVRMTGTNTDITRLKRAEENAEQARREADDLLASSNRSRLALMSLSEDLRESNARFRKLFDVAPVPLIHVDASGHILTFNERFETTFGYSDAEIPTLDHWFSLTCEDATERERLTTFAQSVTAAVASTQTRIRCRNGTTVHTIVSLVRDGENMLGALYDINDRVAAEATLDLQARRAEGLLELPRVGEQKDEQVLINRALALTEELTGSSASFLYVVNEEVGTLELVPGHHPDTVNVPAGKPVALEDSGILREVIEHRTSVMREGLTLQHHALLPVPEPIDRLAIIPVVEDGRVVILLGVANKPRPYVDIDVETLQLVANEAWRTFQRQRSELELYKLSQAVEQSSESIVITNLEGEIEYVNQAFERISGYRRTEVIGRNPRILHSGNTPRATFDSLWESLRQGESWKGQFHNRRKDGSEYVEFAIISPIRRRDGRITHYVAAKEDITEKKRVGEELDRHRYHLEELVVERTRQLAEATRHAQTANRAKSEFLANMSHEIRTPMNAIIGLTHLLRKGIRNQEHVTRLKQIDTAAEHLLRIIDDILDLSKIEAGKLTLEQTDFHVAEILEQVRNLIDDTAREKGLTIALGMSGVDGVLRGDPTRLRQALLNLAGNAVKFTESGSVSLRASFVEEDDEGVVIRFEVEDTGIGIEGETLKTLFRAFQQADTTTTRRYGGTGLGLVITARLAALMGGEVSATSLPGVGSTFHFTARVQRGQNTVTATFPADVRDAAAELERYHGDATLLLVEDDDVSREVALELLQSIGLNARSASNGREALQMLVAAHYDLVLMDVQMPGMDGLTATRALRQMDGYRSTPILALTANVFEEDRRTCLDAGMNDFVSKPVDPDTLFSKLLHWLEVNAREGSAKQSTDGAR